MLLIGGKQRERTALQRFDGPEVSLVKGQETARAEAISQHDDGQIGQAELETRILIMESQGDTMLPSGQPLNTETALGQVLKEPPPSLSSSSLADQVIYFSSDGSRDHQQPEFRINTMPNSGVKWIAVIAERDKWSSIDDEGHSPKP